MSISLTLRVVKGEATAIPQVSEWTHVKPHVNLAELHPELVWRVRELKTRLRWCQGSWSAGIPVGGIQQFGRRSSEGARLPRAQEEGVIHSSAQR